MMVTIVEHQKHGLAILFLDFEKPYDRVDWDFMEGHYCEWAFQHNGSGWW